MSKLEIFKDRNFDSTKDNNFEITEWNENKKNAENLTKKEMEIWEKIKQAKDRMEYMAKTEIADAEDLLEWLTGQKKKEKVDRNIQNHISQWEERSLDGTFAYRGIDGIFASLLVQGVCCLIIKYVFRSCGVTNLSTYINMNIVQRRIHQRSTEADINRIKGVRSKHVSWLFWLDGVHGQFT